MGHYVVERASDDPIGSDDRKEREKMEAMAEKYNFELQKRQFRPYKDQIQEERLQQEKTKNQATLDEQELIDRALTATEDKPGGMTRSDVLGELRGGQQPSRNASQYLNYQRKMSQNKLEKAAPRPERDPVDYSSRYVEGALAFLDSMEPGGTFTDQNGTEVKLTRSIVQRQLASKFPMIRYQSDPRMREALARFPGETAPAAEPEQPGLMDRMRSFWMGSKKEGVPATSQPAAPVNQNPASTGQNPYAKDYPDAFQKDGIWKVKRGGKQYRIEQ